MRLGEVLRSYRKHQEISLRALADRIGTSAPTLMRFENGQDIDGKTLAKIISWLTTEQTA